MPKFVDHDQRRADIGWAVARLIAAEGIQAVSVRAVAAESGYQPSTLRHYFPLADGMTAHALVLISRRQQQRLSAKSWPEDPRLAIREAWCEALPLDDDRRLEAHVWLASSITARSDSARQALGSINEGLDRLCANTIEVYTGRVDDASARTALRAFTDGLALNGIVDPERFTPSVVESSLDRYLDRLQRPDQ
ncbi:MULTISPECIES: TetR/AcrR family transcriptional regulator [Brevibacterium]|uniref:TetR/AcrR family transcriptional regulator n=1 Tax=Brevibacterium TaxID=1696 RepID=UPI001551D4C3